MATDRAGKSLLASGQLGYNNSYPEKKTLCGGAKVPLPVTVS